MRVNKTKQGIFVADDVQRVQRALAKATRAKAANSGGRRCREWIVQKYLERPMLVAGRKFDIRCFVLLAATRKGKQLRGYLYKVVHMHAHPQSTTTDHAMPAPLPTRMATSARHQRSLHWAVYKIG